MAFATTSVTLSSNTLAALPSGSSVGDLVVVLVGTDATTTIANANWTQIDITRTQGTLDVQTWALFYRVIDGTEAGKLTWTIGTASDQVIRAFRFTGRKKVAPITAFAFTASTNGTSPFTKALTGVTAAGGDDVLALWGLDFGGAGAWAGDNYTAGYTESSDETNGFTACFTASRDNVMAGATGSVSGRATRGTDAIDVLGWVVALGAPASPLVAAGAPRERRRETEGELIDSWFDASATALHWFDEEQDPAGSPPAPGVLVPPRIARNESFGEDTRPPKRTLADIGVAVVGSLAFVFRPSRNEQASEERFARRPPIPDAGTPTVDALNFVRRTTQAEHPGEDIRRHRRALPRSADDAFPVRARREEHAQEERRARPPVLPRSADDAFPRRARREEAAGEGTRSRLRGFLGFAVAADPGTAAPRRPSPRERLDEQRPRSVIGIVSQVFVAAAFVLTGRKPARNEQQTEGVGSRVGRRFHQFDFSGTPVYTEAPAERYVWAPPDVRASSWAPTDGPAAFEPPGPAIFDAEARQAAWSPDTEAVWPPDPRDSTA